MVPVLKELCKTHKEILWCVIGQGEREQFLKETISREKLDKYVLWLGSIYDENQLAPWFLSSRVLIHPGAIGLSLLHAFGYGLPVITHGDIENQMPEIAAFENEINGLAFESGSHVSMLSIIENNLFNESKLAALSSNAYITAKTKYNTKVMANRFIEISKNT
jgi:glycosyltransferase involved in cell wall biosynthesis